MRGHNLLIFKLKFDQYEIDASYMEGIREFCKSYCEYIEGGNVEYFRYPEYTESTYFAGNRLDIEWLIYNFTLIILKLVHFADLESEFQNESWKVTKHIMIICWKWV